MDARIRMTIVMCSGVLAMFLAGCGDENTGVGEDMVIVSGFVRNIDDASLAKGVRVSVFDTDFADEVATGDDGAYSVTVPRGTVLHLYTDDFDTSQDEWFPLLNVDVGEVVANENIFEFVIHSCPQTLKGGGGSVERWTEYLGIYDNANEDRFVPKHPADASGILVLEIWLFDNPDVWVSTEGMSVTIPNPAFPVGYVNTAKWIDPAAPVDFIYPSSRMTDDGSGLLFSFGDPAYMESSLEIEVSDPDMVGGRDFPSPFSVPVRPGMITLAHLVAIDGVPGYSFDDFFEAAGLGEGENIRRWAYQID